MKNNRLSVRTSILLITTILWMIFIFWNASRTGDQSRVLSDSITNSIKDNIESNNKVPHMFEGTDAIYSDDPKNESSENDVRVNAYRLKIFIRKSGHLIEYTLLGFLAAMTFISHGFKIDTAFFANMSIVTCVSSLDELIQKFTPGRNGRISDVLIDLCGGTIGTFGAIVFLVIYIFFKKNKKQINKLQISENQLFENEKD